MKSLTLKYVNQVCRKVGKKHLDRNNFFFVVVVVHCTRMIFADFWTDSFLESEGEFGGTVVDVFGEDLLANNLEK